jgi:chorismate mutase
VQGSDRGRLGKGLETVDRVLDLQSDADPARQLGALRRSIDNIDAALVHMLAERFRCTQAVGRLKALHGMPAADPGREATQVARLRDLAHEAQLDPDFAEKFLAFVIREVIRHHEAFSRPPGAADGP